jgi:hypothetical protein
MPITFYMDHHVPRPVTVGLRLRGIDVLIASEDERAEAEDSELLDRATELGRVIFTMDSDFLDLAHEHQMNEESFLGVIYAHQLRISIGACINDLEFLAQAGKPEDFINQVIYLPLD